MTMSVCESIAERMCCVCEYSVFMCVMCLLCVLCSHVFTVCSPVATSNVLLCAFVNSVQCSSAHDFSQLVRVFSFIMSLYSPFSIFTISYLCV